MEGLINCSWIDFPTHMTQTESLVVPRPEAGGKGPWSLPGDVAWWLFLTAEFTTLCMFFVVYAFMRSASAEEFAAAQELLDARIALVNSLILMTSGYCMARALHSLRHRSEGSNAAQRWVLAAAGLGLCFVVVKSTEYAHKFEMGLNLSSGTFWFFYYFLTGFHFLHVLLGLGFLFWVARRLSTGPRDAALQRHAESCGAFWHMLDLVWILLFPLLYLL